MFAIPLYLNFPEYRGSHSGGESQWNATHSLRRESLRSPDLRDGCWCECVL